MKAVIIIILGLLLPMSISAQNYDEYLEAAKKHVLSGDIAKAKIAYNVYVKMTNKTNPEIERILYGTIEDSGDYKTVEYSNGKYIGEYIISICNQLLLNILRVISQKYGHNL